MSSVLFEPEGTNVVLDSDEETELSDTEYVPPIASMGTSPVKISDVIAQLPELHRPENYRMSHLLAAGFRGSEYQLLVLLDQIIKLMLQGKPFWAKVEVDGTGNLDDIAIFYRPKGEKSLIDHHLKTYQVKYYSDPISIYNFFNAEKKTAENEESENSADSSKKTEKMHIGKFLDGWLEWRKKYSNIPDKNLTSIVYSNTDIDEWLSQCVGEDGRLKSKFISHEQVVRISKSTSITGQVPKNFLTKWEFNNHSATDHFSRKTWNALQEAGIIDQSGAFADSFKGLNKLKLLKKSLPPNVSNENVLWVLKKLYKEFCDNQWDLYELLYKEAWEYLKTKTKGRHSDCLQKDETSKKLLFNKFLQSLHFQVQQPDILELEDSLQNNLSELLNDSAEQIYLSLYFSVREWFRKSYQNQMVPTLTKRVMKKLIENSLTRSRDVVLLQGRSQAALSTIQHQIAGRHVDRKECSDFDAALNLNPPLLMVVGENGTGKSSLVKKGLLSRHPANYIFLSAHELRDDVTLQATVLEVIAGYDLIQYVAVDGAEIFQSETAFLQKLFALNRTVILTLTKDASRNVEFQTLINQSREIQFITTEPLELSLVIATFTELSSYQTIKPLMRLAQIPFYLSTIVELLRKMGQDKFQFSVGNISVEKEAQLMKLLIEGQDPSELRNRRLAWMQLSNLLSESQEKRVRGVVIEDPLPGYKALVQESIMVEKDGLFRFSHDLFFEQGLMSCWIQDFEQSVIKKKTEGFWQDLLSNATLTDIKRILKKWFFLYHSTLEKDLLHYSKIILKSPCFQMILEIAIITHQNTLLKSFLQCKEIRWKEILNGKLDSSNELYQNYVSLTLLHHNTHALQLLLEAGAEPHHPEAGRLLLREFSASYILDLSENETDSENNDDSSNSGEDSDSDDEIHSPRSKRRSSLFDEDSNDDLDAQSEIEYFDDHSESSGMSQYEVSENNSKDWLQKFYDNPDKYWNVEFDRETVCFDEEGGEWIDNSSCKSSPDYRKFYLHLATLEDDSGSVAILLDNYQALKQSQVVNLHGPYNQTPLHLAVLKGKNKSLMSLLERNASVYTTDEWGETALHNATYTDNIFAAEKLLEQGASPNAMNADGLSPLHIACTRLNLPMVELFLLYGGDLSLSPFGLHIPEMKVADLLDKIGGFSKQGLEKVENFTLELIGLLNYGHDDKDFEWGTKCKNANPKLRKMQLVEVSEFMTLVEHRAQLSEFAPGFDYVDAESMLEYALEYGDYEMASDLSEFILEKPSRIDGVLSSDLVAPTKSEMLEDWFSNATEKQYQTLRVYANQYKDPEALNRIKEDEELMISFQLKEEKLRLETASHNQSSLLSEKDDNIEAKKNLNILSDSFKDLKIAAKEKVESSTRKPLLFKFSRGSRTLSLRETEKASLPLPPPGLQETADEAQGKLALKYRSRQPSSTSWSPESNSLTLFSNYSSSPYPPKINFVLSPISDEKVIKELNDILGQLNSENISKNSAGLSKSVAATNLSKPIILPEPAIPVEGQHFTEQGKAFVKGKPLFENLLTKKNLVATEVSGDGLNCFIYSLLQHVTGRYDLRKFDESLVWSIKKMAGLSPDSTVMRYDDTQDSLNIVKAINKIYQVNLQVHSIQIDHTGKPIILPPLFDDKASIQRQPLILWLQVNHYVAITSQNLMKKNSVIKTSIKTGE